ncbi:1-deoxy-D-xylulose-5-phosphate synthase [candidate division KSB3 bacterium]|uniref:1-deoxy-D-xylulose-5-phosphate synthase n=1 Tax=candidate division KSB3 bacterium TaxID=2044937 RepID=A0A2G6E2W3_9BACT|nr:MAG: 1-deoxy-D-xylulose-5-phosphate synthase [candidate division KSB3 bacterium]PIE29310.1 MAG: 1-deoxy-D-xylulose-5-phosphate synthase [candidate division KSB3 bacterium]
METLLEQIHSPEDLRTLSEDQLPQLADEARQLIISTLAKTGGHLASNLGVVELTIALHYTFETPKDKLVWDVSHQAYTHKILTGRREQFHTIRQPGGLSGYCKLTESPYDSFGAGHSGTSISAALGMAEARDVRGDQFNVAAVIGDGSLTAGLALEGLNNAGAKKRRKFIVVLNDNEMSISPNVGALSRYLNRLITGNFYNKLKGEVEFLVKTIPSIGESVFKFGKRFDEYLKGFVTHGILFEELGFKYVGPIDGHDLHQMIETFQNVRDHVDRPTLIHVVTRKGKGFKQAEKDATAYHGAPPFCVDTGEFTAQETPAVPSYTKIFGNSLVRLAEDDEKIITITAAMCPGTGLCGFSERFPDRFFDVGIAEQHAVTFAAGLAAEGLKPVAAIYSTFLQRAYDQVLHDVCLQNLPVTFALDRAGLVGADGPTHHGVFDYSFLRHLPNMVVMSPKDENELQHMLKTAIEYPGPASLRYPRGSGFGVELDPEPDLLPVGKAEVLREGNDLLLLAVGNPVSAALEAAKNLQEEDEVFDPAVVNARFVKPLDKDLILDYARNCGKIVTVEENVLQGGFGSAVLELLQEYGLYDVRIRCIALPDKYIEHGSLGRLRRKYGLDAEGIANVVREMLGS